jgi:hypothetical protein
MANNRLVLPDFGNDWFPEMRGKYVILSVKHSTVDVTLFFKPHCLGYTDCLISAGTFTKTEIIIHLGYYKEDIIAVPLTRDAFTTLGLYPIVADYERLKLFAPQQVAATQE